MNELIFRDHQLLNYSKKTKTKIKQKKNKHCHQVEKDQTKKNFLHQVFDEL